MRFEWVVFLVALGFSLVVGALQNSYLFWQRVLYVPLEMTVWVFFFVGVVSFFVSPLVLFASFYLIGRKIDFSSGFQSVIVPLFLGNWAGHLIAYFSFRLWYSSLYAGQYFWEPYFFSEIVWVVVSYALSLEFFVGLSALAIAHIVKRR